VGLVTSVISGLFVAGIIRWISSRDGIQNIKVSKDRIKAINGKWKGPARSKTANNRSTYEYPTELHIRTKGKVIIVDGRLSVENEIIGIKGKGCFFDNQYVYFNYVNSDLKIIHYGSSLLKLSDDGTVISGEVLYCGLGSSISRADVQLSRM
jgi:hypothetical protein